MSFLVFNIGSTMTLIIGIRPLVPLSCVSTLVWKQLVSIIATNVVSHPSCVSSILRSFMFFEYFSGVCSSCSLINLDAYVDVVLIGILVFCLCHYYSQVAPASICVVLAVSFVLVLVVIGLLSCSKHGQSAAKALIHKMLHSSSIFFSIIPISPQCTIQ